MEVVIPVGPPPMMMMRSYIDEVATRDKPSLCANSSLPGSARCDPSGKMTGGMIRLPPLSSSTRAVASGVSSRSIHSYAVRCSAQNALARRQSGHQLAPMTVRVRG